MNNVKYHNCSFPLKVSVWPHKRALELQGLCRSEDVTVSTGSLSPSSLCILPTHTSSHIPLTPLAHIIYLLQPRCDQVAVSDSPTSFSSLLFPSTRGVCCSRHTGCSPTAPRRGWREVQIDPEGFIRLLSVCWSVYVGQATQAQEATLQDTVHEIIKSH